MTGNQAKAQARTAGLLYLWVVISSVFALMMTQNLMVSGDAAATAANIRESEHLFRLAFVANLSACAAYIAVVSLLYGVLKPAGKNLSVVAAFFGLAGCAVSGASMIFHIGTLYYLDGNAAYLAAFEPAQLDALARLSLRMSTLGNSVSLVFFGCYCLLLSSLVFRATFLPKFLGIFLAIAGIGWLAGNITSFVAPWAPYTSMVIPASGMGELIFTLWIMIMGVNAQKWQTQADAA